jgi:hypothetical protein
MLADVLYDENREDLAQTIFEVAGFPLDGCPSWDELVEVRNGTNGRETVARKAIGAFTFVRIPKVYLGMTDAQLGALHERFSIFIRQAVPDLIGYPAIFSVFVQEEDLPHGSNTCLFVGEFLGRGLLQDPVVQELMDFDAFDEVYVTQTLQRLLLGDVLWLHFWRETLEESVPADTVWAVFSFIISHAYLSDHTQLIFSPFCLSQCDQKRWEWYMRGSDMAAPPVGVDAEIADLLGNFEEIAPWGRQKHVGEGQIAADKCVVFLKDVAKGGAVECDYGEGYMLPPGSRLEQFQGDLPETLIEKVLGHFDARVLAAFQAYMALEAEF